MSKVFFEKENGLEIGNNPNQIFKTKLFEIELYNDKGEKVKGIKNSLLLKDLTINT